MEHAVNLSESARSFIGKHVTNRRTHARIADAVHLIATFPFFGKEYDPSFPSAHPQQGCRYFAIHGTPFTLFYIPNEETGDSTIVDIVFSASDPRSRFGADAYVD